MSCDQSRLQAALERIESTPGAGESLAKHGITGIGELAFALDRVDRTLKAAATALRAALLEKVHASVEIDVTQWGGKIIATVRCATCPRGRDGCLRIERGLNMTCDFFETLRIGEGGVTIKCEIQNVEERR